MSFVVAPAPVCLAVDLADQITLMGIVAVKARGARVVLRRATNLTLSELRLITDSGLGVGIIAERRRPGSLLGPTTGHQDAELLLDRVHGVLALPVELTLFDHIEALDVSCDVSDLISHIEAFSFALTEAGDIPGDFIGAGSLLTGDEWGSLPDVHAYWKGANLTTDRYGLLVEPAWHGWQIIQGLPFEMTLTLTGPQAGMNLITQDRKGALPRVLWSNGLQPS